MTPPPPATRATPLDLPRLVLRRARRVAVAFLLLAAGLGVLAARQDTRDEIDGALSLARLGQQLAGLAGDDATALASIEHAGRLRHVRLRLRADGRTLLDTAARPAPALLRWLRAATGQDARAATRQGVSWSIARPGGRVWTVDLTPDPDSEQREALANLLGLFGLMASCCLLMLAVMTWNVRRAFRPLQTLLGAMARIERQDLSGVDALPTMPIRELEATAQALKRLAGALRRAEDARRVLARKILTLQEDERQRLARDLHDEFGQRLTGLRVDAAWLAKRVPPDSPEAAVLAGMGAQVAAIQGNVREMLAVLQPLAGNSDATETLARLAQLLHALAQGWCRVDPAGLRCEARVRHRGVEVSAAGDADAARLALPRAVVLTLYRISQEAFTNAARHAGATRARVALDVDAAPDGGLRVSWSAIDDGCGLALPENALSRGNGLASMQERIWAHGGKFAWTASNAPPMRGLALHARLDRVTAAAAA